MISEAIPYGITEDERHVLQAVRAYRQAGLSFGAIKVQLKAHGCYSGPISRPDLEAWWSDLGGGQLLGEEQ